MALTKVGRGLLNTSIVDNGNATAITIDSSENVGIGTGTPSKDFVVSNGGAEGFEIDAGALTNLTEVLSYNRSTSAWNALRTGASQHEFYVSGTERLRLDAAGRVTMPYQPAFLAKPASYQNNIATSIPVTVVLGTEVFDQGANFASNTFTAPVTGKYQFNWAVDCGPVDNDAVYMFVTLITSNRSYRTIIDPAGFDEDPTYWSFNGAALADMDAGDTAYISIYQGAGAAQVDIFTETYFSGYLVA